MVLLGLIKLLLWQMLLMKVGKPTLILAHDKTLAGISTIYVILFFFF